MHSFRMAGQALISAVVGPISAPAAVVKKAFGGTERCCATICRSCATVVAAGSHATGTSSSEGSLTVTQNEGGLQGGIYDVVIDAW